MNDGTLILAYNPIAGVGLAKRAAVSLREHIGSSYSCQMVEARDLVGTALKHVDTVVVFGGDGTLRPLLPHIADAGASVYLAPCGNESLFARYFGMSAKVESIAQAIRQSEHKECHFGWANHEPFFSMLSIGLDSDVVHAIALSRKGPIGHIGYVGPLVRALIAHHIPHFDIKAESRSASCSGWLVISNTPEYALHVPLAPNASPAGDTFDVRIFGIPTRLRYLRFLLGGLLRLPGLLPRPVVEFPANKVIVRTELEPANVQVDGDAVGLTPVIVSRSVNTLRVLLPPGPT